MFKTAFSIISLNELNFTTPPSYLYNYIVTITIVVKRKIYNILTCKSIACFCELLKALEFIIPINNLNFLNNKIYLNF